jgi:hypothetical protein
MPSSEINIGFSIKVYLICHSSKGSSKTKYTGNCLTIVEIGKMKRVQLLKLLFFFTPE